MTIKIVPSDLSHVRELSNDFREADVKEMVGLGMTPSKALFHSFKQSIFRRTALLDDRVIAMWGVGGAPLSLVGQPYLLTGNYLSNLSPLKFVRIYRQEVEAMRQLFPVLENYVDASYEGAIRVLKLAGFEIHSAVPLGPEGVLFNRFSLVTE